MEEVKKNHWESYISYIILLGWDISSLFYWESLFLVEQSSSLRKPKVEK